MSCIVVNTSDKNMISIKNSCINQLFANRFIECVVCYIGKRQINNQVKTVKMAYKKFVDNNVNSDVPIIIMHGLFGSKANWNSLGESIQKQMNRAVYAVDARNHGDSPHTDEHSYIHLAEDIKLFLSDLKVEKASLIGHSMGGRAIMVYALRYPQDIESLTVVDISPINVINPKAGLAKIIAALNAVKFSDGQTPANVRKSVEKQLTKSLKSEEAAKFFTMNVTEKSKGKFGWKINIDTINKVYETELSIFPIKTGEFKGPTLFVIGGDSDFVNLDDVDKIKKLFPKALFEIIADTGHLVHVERPKIFSRIVCDFIKKAAEVK